MQYSTVEKSRRVPLRLSRSPTRTAPLTELQQKYVRPLKAEFSDRLHDTGTLSMARLEDPDSASASFFIVTARAEALDGKYSVFGRVESGLDVVEAIEAVAVDGETPVARVEIRKVTLIQTAIAAPR